MCEIHFEALNERTQTRTKTFLHQKCSFYFRMHVLNENNLKLILWFSFNSVCSSIRIPYISTIILKVGALRGGIASEPKYALYPFE